MKISICLVLGPLLAFALAISGHAADSEHPSLDLPALAAAGKLPAQVEVTVDDPVYKQRKSYIGYPLALVLKLIPDLARLRAEGAVAIFEAADGYKAVMRLDKALAPGGVIARRDLNAPPGADWLPFKQGKESITPAPYYLVWPGRGHDDWTYVWPYQLVRIAVEPFAAAFGAAAPPSGGKAGANEAAREGFDLFRTYCLRCHSINLVGGDLAPELNVPRNIGEYWRPHHLRAFILDAGAYRARSKMPSFKGVLGEAELNALLAYLRTMAAHKICDPDNPCE